MVLGLILMMIGCTATPIPKCVAPPPPAPTHEEVLEQTKFKTELQEFNLWWASEKTKFATWLSVLAKTPVQLELKEAAFIHEYTVGVIHVYASSYAGDANLFLILTRPDGVWKITKSISDPVLNGKGTTKAESEDEQL